MTVEGPGTCVDSGALAAELDAILPAEIASSPRLRIALTERARPDGVDVRLLLSNEVETLLDRRSQLVAADCPHAARLLARIVARRLAELPRAVWERRGAPPAPPRRLIAGSPQRPGRLHAGFYVAVSTGLPDGDLRTRLASTLAVGLWRALWLDMELGASVSQAVGVGTGDAQPVVIGGALSLGWEFDAGRFGIRPSLGVRAGVLVARGHDVHDAETAVLPALDVLVGVTVFSPWRVHAVVGIAVPTLRARLTLQESPGEWLEPPVRLLGGLGIDWGAGRRPSR